MKRLHVHVAVDELAQSVRFYSTLFAAEPAVNKADYAKRMLEDPRVKVFLALPIKQLDAIAIKRELDAIGGSVPA